MLDWTRASLILGGIAMVGAAVLHVAIIFGGPAWYAFFGAPPDVVTSAREDTWYAPAVTAVIAAILGIWSAYAFSGAGLLARLPFLRIILALIAGVMLLRGLIIVPFLVMAPDLLTLFDYWSSGICFAIGMLYLTGLPWHYAPPPADNQRP